LLALRQQHPRLIAYSPRLTRFAADFSEISLGLFGYVVETPPEPLAFLQ
jgi:hypothetical protein